MRSTFRPLRKPLSTFRPHVCPSPSPEGVAGYPASDQGGRPRAPPMTLRLHCSPGSLAAGAVQSRPHSRTHDEAYQLLHSDLLPQVPHYPPVPHDDDPVRDLDHVRHCVTHKGNGSATSCYPPDQA